MHNSYHKFLIFKINSTLSQIKIFAIKQYSPVSDSFSSKFTCIKIMPGRVSRFNYIENDILGPMIVVKCQLKLVVKLPGFSTNACFKNVPRGGTFLSSLFVCPVTKNLGSRVLNLWISNIVIIEQLVPN